MIETSFAGRHINHVGQVDDQEVYVIDGLTKYATGRLIARIGQNRDPEVVLNKIKATNYWKWRNKVESLGAEFYKKYYDGEAHRSLGDITCQRAIVIRGMPIKNTFNFWTTDGRVRGNETSTRYVKKFNDFHTPNELGDRYLIDYVNLCDATLLAFKEDNARIKKGLDMTRLVLPLAARTNIGFADLPIRTKELVVGKLLAGDAFDRELGELFYNTSTHFPSREEFKRYDNYAPTREWKLPGELSPSTPRKVILEERYIGDGAIAAIDDLLKKNGSDCSLVSRTEGLRNKALNSATFSLELMVPIGTGKDWKRHGRPVADFDFEPKGFYLHEETINQEDLVKECIDFSKKAGVPHVLTQATGMRIGFEPVSLAQLLYMIDLRAGKGADIKYRGTAIEIAEQLSPMLDNRRFNQYIETKLKSEN